ncbi:MAG TPA: hypothetical protein DDX09_09445 [Hyphomonas atlantica]|nr:hypothetical protein [Hyphomonas atlantica]
MADGIDRNIALEIDGKDGSLVFLNPVHPYRGHQIRVRRGGEEAIETIDGKITYEHQLDHVMDVLTGRAAALTGGADALANMAAIDAIYTAAGLSPRGL